METNPEQTIVTMTTNAIIHGLKTSKVLWDGCNVAVVTKTIQFTMELSQKVLQCIMVCLTHFVSTFQINY